MYKLDLPIDIKEKAAIERRRQLEKERQARIFNNKHRLIGVCICIVCLLTGWPVPLPDYLIPLPPLFGIFIG